MIFLINIIEIFIGIFPLKLSELLHNTSEFFWVLKHDGFLFLFLFLSSLFFIYNRLFLFDFWDHCHYNLLFLFIKLFFFWVWGILSKLSLSFILINFFIVVSRLQELVLVESYLWDIIALLEDSFFYVFANKSFLAWLSNGLVGLYSESDRIDSHFYIRWMYSLFKLYYIKIGYIQLTSNYTIKFLLIFYS